MPRVNGSKTMQARFVSARQLIEQFLILGTVAAAIYWLAVTTGTNLANRGIVTGFGFLSKPANLAISESLVAYEPGLDSYMRVLLVGTINTLFVSLTSICLATFIGLSVGMARFSPNWLLNRSARAYVELIRNVPLPLQLLLWYQLLLGLPTPRQATFFLDAVALTNRGLWVPAVAWQFTHLAMLLGAALLGLAVFLVWRRATGRQLAGSVAPARYLWLLFLGLLILAIALRPELRTPVLRGFNIQGGARLSPELAALLFGLSLYSGAFISEILRAGILSVPSGQREAATALGLKPGQIFRRIVLPLSLRFAIPPTAGEYLNVIKNSSLAVIIGYPELTALSNTMLGDTGQPIEAIAIMMLAYLSISAAVSGFMNWYEHHTALVTQ